MEDKEPRPVFKLASSLGCEWPNIRKAHDEADTAKTDLLALLQLKLGERFTSDDASLVIFGSLGRNEWINWESDLDWTFLVDGQCKPGHFEVAHEIRKALKKEYREDLPDPCEKRYRFAEPGATGTFGNMGFSHQLIHLIGGQEDTNKNTTQRILLLLESCRLATETPVGERSTAHERVLKAIIARYLREEAHLLDTDGRCFKVPRFLLNDIVRSWRTMAVDFASKQRDRGGEGWGLRNAKLRMSRKLIFVSGLLTCFSCNLDPNLQAKISKDKHDTNATRNLNLIHLENHIMQFVSKPPLDILAMAVMEYGVDDLIAERLFSAYDEFLGLVADREKREHLKKLRAEESRGDKVFAQVQKFSEQFAKALNAIFFENQKLKDLTQEYGVF
jgi:hypothetical protein